MSFSKGHGHELLPKPPAAAWAQWLSRKRIGVGVGLVVVAAVMVLQCLFGPAGFGRLERMAKETGSVAEFWEHPVPNHAGTHIIYQQSTETGIGVFLAEMPGGNAKLLYELPEKFATKDRGALNLRVWGWAPDDSLLAFSHLNVSNRLIVICNGRTGEREAEARVSRQIKGLVWLDADTVAFVNERDDLYYWGAGPGKRGSSPVSFVKRGVQKPAVAVRSLVALAPDTIAWHDGGGIWSWRFGADQPTAVWTGPTNNIVDMAVDARRQNFLLRLKDADGEGVARVEAASGRFELLRRFAALPRETNKNQVVWLPGGFAHSWGGVARHAVSVYPRFGGPAHEIVFRGGILSYTAVGGSLYLVGSRAGEPPGVWRYRGPDSLTCVLSNPVAQYRLAKPVAPERHEFITASGYKISYWLWSPPRVLRGKKYPLLVGGPCWGWDSYRSAVVNGGAYLVNVERDDWYSDWTEGVQELVEHLRTRIPLDDREFYLFGTSAQVSHAARLLERAPETWRGMLMFGPGGAGPALEIIKGHRLLVDCGADDRYTEGALRYRDEALKRGIAITTMVHQDAEHTYRSIRSVRARDQAVMRFMFQR
jgi:hypothetical protein